MPKKKNFWVVAETVGELREAIAEALFELPPLLRILTAEEEEVSGILRNAATITVGSECVVIDVVEELVEWKAVENAAHNDPRLNSG